MFGQNDNNQPVGSGSVNDGTGTDFSKAMSDLSGSAPNAPAPPPAWGHPGQPIDNPSGAQQPAVDDNSGFTPSDQPLDQSTEAPASDMGHPEGEMQVQDFGSPSTDVNPADEGDLNKLIELKQKALGELNPLVEHLDQNNEEKFNTLMMMIQASDDQSLIEQAYQVAQNITDEKARAQALLDVVNEINYFTQQH